MSDDSSQTSGINEQWRQVGARLRDAREFMGFSQAEIAEVLGISRPAVTGIEAGRRRVTGLELKTLAKLYERPYDYFLGEDVEVEDNPIIAAIYRVSRDLSDEDREEVRRYAEYVRSRRSSAHGRN